MDEESEFESKLIDIVRDYWIVWDKRDDRYRKKKDRIWNDIASKLNTPDFLGKDCQKLWEKLRNQFMAHQRKLRRPTGSGTERRPYFRHESAMRFIRDSMKDGSTYSNLGEGSDRETEAGDREEEAANLSSNEDVENVPPVLTQKSRDAHRVHKKFRGKRKLDSFDENLIEMLKTETKDEYSAFGDLVAAILRKLGEIDKKGTAEVQYNMQFLIHELEMKVL